MTSAGRGPPGDAAPAPTRSAAQIKAILDERARALARAPEDPRADDAIGVLAFELAGQRYAIEARWTIEILRVEEVVPLPGAPDFIAGLFNRRGEILLAVDLRALLGGPPSSDDGARLVIVIGEERAEIGLIAGGPPELQPLCTSDAHPTAGLLPASARDLVFGITGDALIVVDAAALLADERLFLDYTEPIDGRPTDREGA